MGQVDLIGLSIGNALAYFIDVLCKLLWRGVRVGGVQVPRHILRVRAQPSQSLAARHGFRGFKCDGLQPRGGA